VNAPMSSPAITDGECHVCHGPGPCSKVQKYEWVGASLMSAGCMSKGDRSDAIA
jgi:hypothetical protein